MLAVGLRFPPACVEDVASDEEDDAVESDGGDPAGTAAGTAAAAAADDDDDDDEFAAADAAVADEEEEEYSVVSEDHDLTTRVSFTTLMGVEKSSSKPRVLPAALCTLSTNALSGSAASKVYWGLGEGG